MALEKFRGAYETFLEWLAIVLVTALFVEVTLGVVFRTFGESLVWYDEVASILLAWLTFYGSALASAKRAHIGCPEVMAFLPPGPKLFFRVVAELLTIGFFLLLGWEGFRVLGALEGDTLVSLPEISVAWTQSVIPVSAVLILVAEIVTLPAKVRQCVSPAGEATITGGALH